MTAWECDCGHIEYSSEVPVECEKCFKIDSFIQLAEDFKKERDKLIADDDLDDAMMIPGKKSAPKMKKPKLKPRRKRK